MRTTFIYCLLLLIPVAGNAQKTSKLRSWDRTVVPAQVYIDSALRLSTSNPSKAFDYVEKALTQGIQMGDKQAEALAYQTLGKINYGLNQHDLAISYYLKAILVLENLKDKEQLNQTRVLLGDAYLINNQTDKALKTYEQCLSYFERKDDPSEALALENKIADIYTKTGQKKQASSLYKKVAKDAESKGNKKIEIEAQTKLGDIYIEEDRSQEALDAYNKAEVLANETKDNNALINTLNQKSKVYRSNKQYNTELELRNNIIDLETQNNNPSAVAQQNIEIANIYMAQNAASKAIPLLERTISLSDEAGDLEQKGKALQTLSKVYSSQKDFSQAFEVYKKYVETIDAQYKSKEEDLRATADAASTISRKLQRLDLIEKELTLSEKTLDILKQEQQVNQKELKSRKIFNISIGIAFLVLTVASFLFYRSSRQKRQANQLLALKSLRSQMNPHFIYNALNSVNNYISKNDEKSANKYLADFSKLMRSVMENSKHDFVSLQSEIDIITLYLKLEQSRFSDKFDYDFKVSPAIETESYLVPPMLIQPFIENAVWHGLRYRNDKGFLNITIEKVDHSLKVIIEDNGIGRKKSEEIKTKNQKEHVSTGLRNIENRIKIINELYQDKIGITIEDLDKTNETGTRATILIPLKHEPVES